MTLLLEIHNFCTFTIVILKLDQRIIEVLNEIPLEEVFTVREVSLRVYAATESFFPREYIEWYLRFLKAVGFLYSNQSVSVSG